MICVFVVIKVQKKPLYFRPTDVNTDLIIKNIIGNCKVVGVEFNRVLEYKTSRNYISLAGVVFARNTLFERKQREIRRHWDLQSCNPSAFFDNLTHHPQKSLSNWILAKEASGSPRATPLRQGSKLYRELFLLSHLPPTKPDLPFRTNLLTKKIGENTTKKRTSVGKFTRYHLIASITRIIRSRNVSHRRGSTNATISKSWKGESRARGDGY